MPTNELIRFLDAQNQMYLKALSEIRSARKVSHWMWFIFPQLEGLGASETAKFYAIKSLDEATAYFHHPVLGKHLVEISSQLLDVNGKEAVDIFGTPDDLKLRSSMTLFAQVENTSDVFEKVLAKYFKGQPDERTLQLLGMTETSY
jgi:uncharacterized protein (DUF1810 family)